MGFLDSLFGRTTLPKSNEDKLFAMSTAAVGLQAAAGINPAGRAGIVFKRLPEMSTSNRQRRRTSRAADAGTAVSTARNVATSAVRFRGVYSAAVLSPSAWAFGSGPNRSTNCQYTMPRGSSRWLDCSSSSVAASMRSARPSRAQMPQRNAFFVGVGASRSQRNASTTTGPRQVAQVEP